MASSSITQGRPAGPLCLRIRGTARDGQIVQLSARKCSIGSARGCTLRLRAVGVRPIECLLLRGSRGTVVRACGAAIKLNGQPTCDAMIDSGDRLQIGPIEFEVLGDCPSTELK
jgi:hypothetical protein